jgi:hypothetical protein
MEPGTISRARRRFVTQIDPNADHDFCVSSCLTSLHTVFVSSCTSVSGTGGERHFWRKCSTPIGVQPIRMTGSPASAARSAARAERRCRRPVSNDACSGSIDLGAAFGTEPTGHFPEDHRWSQCALAGIVGVGTWRRVMKRNRSSRCRRTARNRRRPAGLSSTLLPASALPKLNVCSHPSRCLVVAICVVWLSCG